MFLIIKAYPYEGEALEAHNPLYKASYKSIFKTLKEARKIAKENITDNTYFKVFRILSSGYLKYIEEVE